MKVFNPPSWLQLCWESRQEPFPWHPRLEPSLDQEPRQLGPGSVGRASVWRRERSRRGWGGSTCWTRSRCRSTARGRDRTWWCRPCPPWGRDVEVLWWSCWWSWWHMSTCWRWSLLGQWLALPPPWWEGWILARLYSKGRFQRLLLFGFNLPGTKCLVKSFYCVLV